MIILYIFVYTIDFSRHLIYNMKCGVAISKGVWLVELTKREIEFILSIYELFFAKINEFENIDDLADYISEQINYYDKQLIDVPKNS